MYAILQIEIYEGTTGKARSRTLSTFIIMWSFRKYCIKCTGRNKSFPPKYLRNGRDIVVNKQTESHKGFISYLHEAELLYNDVYHSQPTL